MVLLKGYGVRKLGETTPVDENTLFGIGSNTKAFTAAALATLVDQGKISWDDPVYERLKGFEMYDPYVSKEMQIRDLLCHRSGLGLGEGDLMFWPHTTFTRDDVVYRLAVLEAEDQLSNYLCVQQSDVCHRRTSGGGGEREKLGRLLARKNFLAAGDEQYQHERVGVQARRRLGRAAFEGGREAAANPD